MLFAYHAKNMFTITDALNQVTSFSRSLRVSCCRLDSAPPDRSPCLHRPVPPPRHLFTQCLLRRYAHGKIQERVVAVF